MPKVNIVPYSTLLESNDWTFKYLNEVTNLSKANKSIIKEDRLIYSGDTVVLNDLVDVNPDKLYKDSFSSYEEYSYIDVSSISSTKGLIKSAKRIAGSDLPARARLIIRKGDILLSTVRPERNIVAFVPAEFDGCIVNSTLAVLRPKVKIKGEILYFLLRSNLVRRMLNIKARGTAVPTISIKEIKALRIPISKDILFKMQDKAQILYSEWVALNNIKKSFSEAIEEAFIDYNIFTERYGLKTSESLYKTYPYNQLKDRLDVNYYFNETSNISSSVDFVKFKGLIKNTKSGLAISSKNFKKQGIPYIRIKDLEDEGIFIQSEDLAFIDDKDAVNYSKYTTSEDDVLISKVGTIGKAALVQSEMEGAVISQHLISIELKENILPEFLVYYLKTSWARKEFERRAGGSAQQFLKVQGIEDIPIPLPPFDKQKKIVDHIRKETSNDQIEMLEIKIKDFIKNLY